MPKTRPDKEHPSDLQELFDRIECGSIEDITQLTPADIVLLERYYGGEEELTALFDRLRGGDRER